MKKTLLAPTTYSPTRGESERSRGLIVDLMLAAAIVAVGAAASVLLIFGAAEGRPADPESPPPTFALHAVHVSAETPEAVRFNSSESAAWTLHDAWRLNSRTDAERVAGATTAHRLLSSPFEPGRFHGCWYDEDSQGDVCDWDSGDHRVLMVVRDDDASGFRVVGLVIAPGA